MDKKLLVEISRIHEIMGIKNTFLHEALSMPPGGWIDDLIKNSPKVFEALDNILKKIRTGVELTDSQIDEVVDGLKKAGKLTDQEAKELKSLLKNDAKLRELLNTTDNFLNDLKKVYPEGVGPEALRPLAKVGELTAKEIEEIVKNTVKKLVVTPGSKAFKLLSKFEDVYLKYLDEIMSSGHYIDNVDEIYDFMDNKLNKILQDNVANGNITQEVADSLFTEVSSGFRNSERLQTKIAELENDGRILGTPKKTTSVKFGDVPVENANFNDIKVKTESGDFVKKPSQTTRKKPSSLLDDSGKPIEKEEKLSDDLSSKYENIKNKPVEELTESEKEFLDEVKKWENGEDNLPKIQEKANKVEQETIDGLVENIDDPSTWGPMIVNEGLSPHWSDIFFRKTFQGPWGEWFVNFFRGMFRKPETFLKEIEANLVSIENKFKELQGLNPGDARYQQVQNELETLTNRLKSNMMLAQTPEKMFVSQWEEVKNILIYKSGLKYNEAQKLIDFLGKSGNPKVSIETFAEWCIKEGNRPELRSVFGGYKSAKDYFNSTKFAEWVKSYTDIWKTGEGALFQTKLLNLGKKLLSDFLVLLFKRIPNILTIGIFSFTSELRLLLKGTGRMAGLGGLRNLTLAYIQVMLVANLVHPFLNMLGNIFQAQLEFLGVENINLEKKTIWEQFKSDLYERIPIMGEDFEWNPFYNPIPGGVGQQLGFKEAPLPRFILEGILKIFNYDTSEDQNNKNLKAVEKTFYDLQNEFYSNLTPEEKEKLKDAAGFTAAKSNIIEQATFNGLSSSEAKIIEEHLFFKLRPPFAPTGVPYQPTKESLAGQVWFCTTKLELDELGNDKCTGESYRIVVANTSFLAEDKDLDRYYEKAKVDPNTLWGHYVYITNRNVENVGAPPIGSNFKNIAPIKDLLSKLK